MCEREREKERERERERKRERKKQKKMMGVCFLGATIFAERIALASAVMDTNHLECSDS